MRSEQATRVKQSGWRRTRAATSTSPRQLKPIPPATLNTLKKLVAKHRSKDLTATWELGRLARKTLGHTKTSPAPGLAIAELAEQIGLVKTPDPTPTKQSRQGANLRYMMKFSRIATRRQAVGLNRARLPWRGVVFWMGVSNPSQRRKLYRKMVKGRMNSTRIRADIETSLKKKSLPRFSGDCDKDFEKVKDQTESFTRVLDGLCQSLDRHEDPGSDWQPQELLDSLKNAKRQINATMRKLR